MTDLNRFTWPGPDLRPPKAGDAASVACGLLPASVYEELRDKFIKSAARRGRAAGRIEFDKTR